MTLVALSLTSSQFGPRLLRSFMRDTTTQVVLGTFVATFLYCLLVLRTIRRVEESHFVPHLSVTLGVLFAVGSVGVLIYFIHHVSVSIQANEIVARVAAELNEGIDRWFVDHANERRRRLRRSRVTPRRSRRSSEGPVPFGPRRTATSSSSTVTRSWRAVTTDGHRREKAGPSRGRSNPRVGGFSDRNASRRRGAAPRAGARRPPRRGARR